MESRSVALVIVHQGARGTCDTCGNYIQGGSGEGVGAGKQRGGQQTRKEEKAAGTVREGGRREERQAQRGKVGAERKGGHREERRCGRVRRYGRVGIVDAVHTASLGNEDRQDTQAGSSRLDIAAAHPGTLNRWSPEPLPFLPREATHRMARRKLKWEGGAGGAPWPRRWGRAGAGPRQQVGVGAEAERGHTQRMAAGQASEAGQESRASTGGKQ